MVLDVIKKVDRSSINLQRFLDDMAFIRQQSDDPALRKPAVDVGASSITNYLLWLILAEMMIMNNRSGNNA